MSVGFSDCAGSRSSLRLNRLHLLSISGHIFLPVRASVELLIAKRSIVRSFFIPDLNMGVSTIPKEVGRSSVFLLEPKMFCNRYTRLYKTSRREVSVMVRNMSASSCLT